MLGITLLTLTIFGAFAIRPTLVTITTLRKKIKDQERAEERLEKKIKSLSLAQTEMQKNKSDIPLAAEALPSERDLAGILETLSSLSEKEGLRLSRLSLKDSGEVPQNLPNGSFRVGRLGFSLQLEGDFPHFLAFLKNIEGSLRQINPTRIRIHAQEDRGIETYNLELDTYFTKQ